MSDDGRGPASNLKGRLADVFIPALVAGSLEGLSRRLGNRATVDDPVNGRASSLASLDPLLAKVSRWFIDQGALYRHVYSTTGVDRDAAEGVLQMKVGGESRELPVAVVAERRRLREIELRLYYLADGAAKRKTRPPLVTSPREGALPAVVSAVLDALRAGAKDDALAAFEETSRVVDPSGQWHIKKDGAMAALFGELGAVALVPGGNADDGRTCCVEASLGRAGREHSPAVLSFQRGDSGLLRELRLYWD